MNRYLEMALDNLKLDEELKNLLGLQSHYQNEVQQTAYSNNDEDGGGSSFIVNNS